MDPRTAAVLNTCQAFGLTKQASVAFARAKQAAEEAEEGLSMRDHLRNIGENYKAYLMPMGVPNLAKEKAEASGHADDMPRLRAVAGAGLVGGLAGTAAGYLGRKVSGGNPMAELLAGVGGAAATAPLGSYLATRHYYQPSEE